MSENPFQPPESSPTSSPPRKEFEKKPRGMRRRRFVAAISDLFLFSAAFLLIMTTKTLEKKGLLPGWFPVNYIGKINMGILVVTGYLPQLISFLGGATLGMRIWGLCLSDKYDSRIRNLLVMIARNFGLIPFSIMLILIVVAPDADPWHTLHMSENLFISIFLGAPCLQVIAGLFVLGPSGVSLMDRLTRTRIVIVQRRRSGVEQESASSQVTLK